MKKLACLMLMMIVIGCGQQAPTESASTPAAAEWRDN